MPTPGWTRLVIGLAAATWVLVLSVTGGSFEAVWAEALGYAASIVLFLLLVFDRWVWRWPGVRRLVRRPVLHGTWKVELRTSYEARKEEVIEAYLVIRQTYSEVTVAALLDRSRSRSMSAHLAGDEGRWALYYLYDSEKNTLARKGNPPARGAAELVVAATPTLHLEGDYWTEVRTRGQITSVGHSRKVFDTYDAARQGAYA